MLDPCRQYEAQLRESRCEIDGSCCVFGIGKRSLVVRVALVVRIQSNFVRSSRHVFGNYVVSFCLVE